MDGTTDFAAKLTEWLQQASDVALGWLLSPAAWSQFGLLIVALIVARLATAASRHWLRGFWTPVTRQAIWPACAALPSNLCRFSCR